jgi:hypothetical protein
MRIVSGYLCFSGVVMLCLAAWYRLVSWPWALLSLLLFLAAYKLLRKDRPYDFNDSSDVFPYTLGDGYIDLNFDVDSID